MHINAARHDDIARGIQHPASSNRRVNGRIHDSTIIDPDVANLIVNPVLGINNAAADDLKE